MADLIFAFTIKCAPPTLHDLAVPSIQFADDICNFSSSEAGIRASIECTLQYCSTNRFKVNLQKSCYTVFNDTQPNRSDIVIHRQTLKYDPHPCYLGMCLSNDRSDLNSVMIRKASKAAFAFSTMLSSSTSATLLNRLFSQLIEPILLYAVEWWIPYVQKIGQIGAHHHLWIYHLPTQHGGCLEEDGIFTVSAQCHHPHHCSQIRVGVLPNIYPGNCPPVQISGLHQWPRGSPSRAEQCCQSSHGPKGHQLLLQVRLVEQLVEAA